MGNKITRRNFIKKGAALGASSSMGTAFLSKMLKAADKPDFLNEQIDVAVATGNDYF